MHHVSWDEFVDLVTVVWLFVFVIGLVYPDYSSVTDTINLGLLPVFIADLYVGYRRTGDLRTYIRKKWLDILLVIPFLRILRIIRIIRVVKTVKAVKTMSKTTKIIKTTNTIKTQSLTTKASYIEKTIKFYKKTKRIIKKLINRRND